MIHLLGSHHHWFLHASCWLYRIILCCATIDPRPLVFLHIPKTGGTTLNRIIEWQYNPLSIFTVDPFRVRATVERFKTFSDERRLKYHVVRGHLHYGIHEYLPQGADYITLLREPTARVLSSYHFILRRPLHPLHRKLRADKIGVEEFLRLTAHRQNLQTRFIAGIGPGGICDKRTLAVAKDNLSHFRVVGLCERFEESLMLMIDAFGWNVVSYQNCKVSKHRPAPEPGVIDVIREHNQLDVRLYDYATELFHEKLRESEPRTRANFTSGAVATSPLLTFGTSCRSTVGFARFVISKIASAI